MYIGDSLQAAVLERSIYLREMEKEGRGRKSEGERDGGWRMKERRARVRERGRKGRKGGMVRRREERRRQGRRKSEGGHGRVEKRKILKTEKEGG
jgi:hypothetical protein